MKRVLKVTLDNVKKMKEIKLIPKVLLLLTLGFGIKLFFSCTPSTPDPFEIDYNNLSVTGIDNSEMYLAYHQSIDTLYSDAVTLKLTLSDTSEFYSASFSKKLMQTLSFPTLRADWSPSYIPRNKVVDIKVITLFDVSESIKAGDEITEHLLYAARDSFDLYHNLSQGISKLNGMQSNDRGSVIVLVLKVSVENTQSQFEVKVTLENGDELSSTTELFTIIES